MVRTPTLILEHREREMGAGYVRTFQKGKNTHCKAEDVQSLEWGAQENKSDRVTGEERNRQEGFH